MSDGWESGLKGAGDAGGVRRAGSWSPGMGSYLIHWLDKSEDGEEAIMS